MNAEPSSLIATSRRIADACQILGIDAGADVAAVKSFLEGPPVIAIVGLPKTGRTTLETALTAVHPEYSVTEIDIRAVPSLHLWDALIVVTPADQALSMLEENLARAAHSSDIPVAVCVTHIDMLGEADARAAARQEITELRLKPILGVLHIPWFFLDAHDSIDPLATFISQSTRTASVEIHRRPALNALASILEVAIGQLRDRLESRERERQCLHQVESAIPLVFAQLEESVKLAKFYAREALRTCEQKLFEAATAVSTSAAAWVAQGGGGAWSDVEYPLRTAWAALPRELLNAVGNERRKFQEEAQRAVQMALAPSTPPIPINTPMAFSELWTTPEFADEMQAFTALSLEPLFQDLSQRCEEVVARARTRAESDDDAFPAILREPDRREGFLRRIATHVTNLSTAPLDDRLRTLVMASLEAIVSPRFARLIETLTRSTEERAKADVAATMATLKGELATVRARFDARQNWDTAYRELLELRSGIEGVGTSTAPRVSGVRSR